MTALFASSNYAEFAFFILVPVAIGVPCVLWGALMTLSGLYEQRQALREGGQKSSRKLAIGITLIVLGAGILTALAAMIALTT